MKKILFTLAIGIATLTSCTEDDSITTPPSDEVGVLLKKIIDTFDDGSTAETIFTYNGNKLIKTEEVADFGNGLETYIDEYTYTGELLTRIDHSGSDSMGNPDSEYTILEYDASNRLITETYYYASNTDVNTYVHNVDGTITFNESGGMIYVYTFVNGNIIQEDNTNGDSDYTSTYDNKNGYLKNIHQSEVFALLGDLVFQNNLLTYSNTGGLFFNDNEANTYVYNSGDYPVTSTTVSNPGEVNEEVSNAEFFYE